MREASVKNRVKQILSEHRVFWYMPIPQNRRGIADFQCCVGGIFLMIETKGTGGRLSKLQKHMKKIVEESGGLFWVVTPDNLEELPEKLRQLKAATITGL